LRKKLLIIIISLLLVSAVYAASFSASRQNVEMKIEGMSCPLCPLAVKRSLSRVKGVKNVEVSYDEQKALLSADESTSDEALIKAVEKAGPYSVTSIERKPMGAPRD